jgi:hypothetical protein
MKKRTIIIIGAVLVLIILSLFIPAIRQGRDLTSTENDRENVIYDGNSEDTGNTGDTTDHTMERR